MFLRSWLLRESKSAAAGRGMNFIFLTDQVVAQLPRVSFEPLAYAPYVSVAPTVNGPWGLLAGAAEGGPLLEIQNPFVAAGVDGNGDDNAEFPR